MPSLRRGVILEGDNKPMITSDGETAIVDVPLKFEICADGKAAAEANQTVKP